MRRTRKTTRWSRWRRERERYWVQAGTERKLAERWALAEQQIRMRVAVLLSDDIAEPLDLIVTPAGDLTFDFDQLI